MKRLLLFVTVLTVVSCLFGCTTGSRQRRMHYQNAQTQYWQGYERAVLDIPPSDPPTGSETWLKAWKNKRVARREAQGQFWVVQGKTYWQDLPDLNSQGSDSSLPRAALKYYRGVLYNHRTADKVTFVIEGSRYGVIRTLNPGQKEWILLPAGACWVELYCENHQNPYRWGWRHPDKKEADAEVEEQVCDFSMIAP